MKKKTIRDLNVMEQRVLVRVDFNVPLKDGEVADDTRIRAALPTIRHLIENGAKTILCSHLGRPKGEPDDKYRMDPVADKLAEILGRDVKKLDDCIGPEIEEAVAAMQPRDVIMLENTRFHKGEKKNDEEMAKGLAALADIYVNDAFAAAHRAHASTEGVARFVKQAAAGMLMERELAELSSILEEPEKPFVAILGGAKISDKIGVIENLLPMMDHILVGGGMANTLLWAKGVDVADSLVDEESLDQAKKALDMAGDKLVLPEDAVAAKELAEGAEAKTVAVSDVPRGYSILDVGPRTVENFSRILADAKTAVWNGPLGAFETEPFDRGTVEVAKVLAAGDAKSVIGGGDSAAAVAKAGVADRITHVSTGGGAFLEFMEGKTLPGVAALGG
jgi:phosphoglycerate kinase